MLDTGDNSPAAGIFRCGIMYHLAESIRLIFLLIRAYLDSDYNLYFNTDSTSNIYLLSGCNYVTWRSGRLEGQDAHGSEF